MATTGIWKIEKRLDHVIDYVTNPEKTVKGKSYQELHNFSDYDNMNYDTEETCYISGINCSTHRTYKDMMHTKSLHEKEGGILGYHAFQSFMEGEVTPGKAHLIGIKLAEEMWGDNYEVIVTTHINTNHIHNHFVINSVGFKDGKKYHDCHENYAMLRQLSDSLCEEYGLNVIDKTKMKKSKVNYENYYKNHIKKNNYYTLAKNDLDKAIGMAYSFKDFENIMIKMGYEINNRYNKLSIRRNPYKKNIRIERAFGNDYSIESIEKRIEIETRTRVPFIEAYNPSNQRKIFEEHKKEKAHGIYGLYKYYCYILNVYPKQYPNKILTPALRVEVNKLDQISKQTQLLVNHKIETYEQLLFYKDTQTDEVRKLVANRHNLWVKHKRTQSEDEKASIRYEIDNITKMLVSKRREVKLCEGIVERLGVVKENIKEFEEDKEKGEMKR